MAETYEAAARAAGHEVDRMNLGEMRFDPYFTADTASGRSSSPTCFVFRNSVKACDHFVVIHPVWWVGMPALLKGLSTARGCPAPAFRYMKLPSGKRSAFWHRMFRWQIRPHHPRERYQSVDGVALTGQRKCAAQMGDSVVRGLFRTHGMVRSVRKYSHSPQSPMATASSVHLAAQGYSDKTSFRLVWPDVIEHWYRRITQCRKVDAFNALTKRECLLRIIRSAR